jgi:hypothetical protein
MSAAMTADTLLFVVLAIVMLALVYGVWRYWDNLVELSPDEEEYDKRVANLNERQANRLSDEQLTQPPNDDDAWAIILRRGRRAMRRPRYGGDFATRTRERRTRDRR